MEDPLWQPFLQHYGVTPAGAESGLAEDLSEPLSRSQVLLGVCTQEGKKGGMGDPHSWSHWVLEGPQSLAHGPRDLRTCAK